MARILIAEDEGAINTLVKKNLELVGHTCFSVFDGEAALEEIENAHYDLILLDIMMPKMDGFAVIEEVGKRIPIIFLSARSAVADRVRGLKLGADDYIVKPFDMLELQARVESVLRRVNKADMAFTLGDVKVDFLSQQVFVNDCAVEMSPKEFLLVEALIKNRNIALSRDKLLEMVWGYDFYGDTRTVDVHIHALRKKLNWDDIIKTVYKLGYRLEVK
ncbi:MAG: response regulator transcription factor [Defluviitaleaceae bacterium]|nr:response regulator transcription factor [Defluviitaleaceae bacterium]MCL2274203.1 response regulator transcription factor [Defluviitaleaceae bacterium]